MYHASIAQTITDYSYTPLKPYVRPMCNIAYCYLQARLVGCRAGLYDSYRSRLLGGVWSSSRQAPGKMWVIHTLPYHASANRVRSLSPPCQSAWSAPALKHGRIIYSEHQHCRRCDLPQKLLPSVPTSILLQYNPLAHSTIAWNGASPVFPSIVSLSLSLSFGLSPFRSICLSLCKTLCDSSPLMSLSISSSLYLCIRVLSISLCLLFRFFISPDNMPVFWTWLYWISPLRYDIPVDKAFHYVRICSLEQAQ